MGLLGWELGSPVIRHFFAIVCLACITLIAPLAGSSEAGAQGIRPTPAVDAGDATAQTRPAGVARCMVGVYLLSLHDFSFSENTFDATFWLWIVCPDTFTQPMDTLEFVNAVDVELSPGRDQQVANAIYRPTKVSGTFRHTWDLADFPFDRQTLEIVIEDAEYTVEKLVYIPDDAQSDYHPDAAIGTWHITDFGISSAPYTYNTTFGDPSWVQGDTSSDYSRLRVGITLERTAYTGFFKLTSVVYIAFLLSLVSFLVRVDTTTDLGTRLALVSGALFAAAINMQVASNSLGNQARLSLVDQIHLIAFATIFFAAAVAIASRLLLDTQRSHLRVQRMNYVAMTVSAVVFIASNLYLINAAADIV